MLRRFRGGIRPPDSKDSTKHKPIEKLPPPEIVAIPVLMHQGVPCEPIISPDQEIFLGQLIADSREYIAAPIHSPVSGKIRGIEDRPHPNGSKVRSIIIENDGKDTLHHSIKPQGSVEALSSEQLLGIIRGAGIVGLGGSAVPTHYKISETLGNCDTVIINAAECEPCITGDHRLMLEAPEEILGGLRVLMKILEPKHAVVALQSNNRDALDNLRRTLPGTTNIKLAALPPRYPEGSERLLVKTITGREIPPGKPSHAAKCLVLNAQTAAALHRAVTTGRPLINRIITVAGSAVSNAKNLSVRFGTPFSAIFEATGGFREPPVKVLVGGPMMGIAQHDLSAPLVKSCSSLLAFSKKDAPISGDEICNRCGRCVRVCPSRLMPVYLYMNERKNRISELERLHIEDCIECGACSYICPGKLYLVHSIRTGKQKLLDQKRTEAAKQPEFPETEDVS